MSSDASGFAGTMRPDSASSAFNAQAFLIQSMIGRISTVTLVKVMACTNDGSITPPGFVDILPLVNQVDGAGNAVPHVTIYRCPYFRLQGGGNAVVLDPQPGDIGIALFADRDISSVTVNKGQANPGSGRRFDMADALYLGGVLNDTPTQFVQFSSTGVRIHSPTQVKLDAPEVLIEANAVKVQAQTVNIKATTSTVITTPTFTVNGATQLNGPVTGSSTITAPNVIGTTNVTFGGKSGIAHVHNLASGGTTLGPA